MANQSNRAARALTTAPLVLTFGGRAARLLRALAAQGFECAHQHASEWSDLRLAAARRSFHVILADHADLDLAATLRSLRASGVQTPLILVTKRLPQEDAIAAIKAGVYDCVHRDDPGRLAAVIEEVLAGAAPQAQPRGAGTSSQARDRAHDREGEVSAALAAVAQELITSLDTPNILHRLGQATRAALACDYTHTFLLEDDWYVPVTGHGDTPELWQSMRLIRIPRHRLERGESVRAGDVTLLEGIRGQPVSPWLPAHRVGAGLLVPLHRGSELVGSLTAGLQADGFAPNVARIAIGIAHLASLALQNARLVEDFERADHSRADFVANLSHELRTPLNVVIGYSDLLLDEAFGAVVAEQRDAVRRIGEQAREVIGLVNTTLDLSRIEAGRVPLDVEDVDLGAVLDEIERETRVSFGERDAVTFSRRVEDGLPPLATDAVKLKVVIKNLVTNAMKFTLAGTVTVTAERSRDGFEVAVVDTGPGIARDQQSLIFEAFRQVDVGKGVQKGVGLGLHIVQRLLVVLGGTIRVDSEPGRGAAFRVWLPAQAPQPGTPRRGD